MATIRKIQRKSGIVYYAIIKDRLGKAITSKTFTRKTDALIWSKRIESDQEAIEALGNKGSKLTFKRLVEEYMSQWNGKDKCQTYRLNYWLTQFGEYRINNITADLIRQKLKNYQQGQCVRGHGRKGVTVTLANKRKPATVNRQRNTLSGIFKYAFQQGYISENPLRKISRLKDDRKIIRYLSIEERASLLTACKASMWPKLHLLVLLAMTTGMRSSELINLRWSNIDFVESLVFLYITKNGDPRVCPIPSHTMNELKKFREPGDGYVFPSSIKPDQPFVFKKHWLEAKEVAKVENFRFHDLRHDYCSQLAMNGAGLHEIAELAGHKDLATTQRYTHLSVQHKQEIAERIMSKVIQKIMN